MLECRFLGRYVKTRSPCDEHFDRIGSRPRRAGQAEIKRNSDRSRTTSDIINILLIPARTFIIGTPEVLRSVAEGICYEVDFVTDWNFSDESADKTRIRNAGHLEFKSADTGLRARARIGITHDVFAARFRSIRRPCDARPCHFPAVIIIVDGSPVDSLCEGGIGIQYLAARPALADGLFHGYIVRILLHLLH